MKKILFAIPLFAMLLVACDPIVDEISPDPNVTPENLTFELVAKNQGNNNIQIVPTPSRYVKVYDATSDIKLAEGTAPSVQVAPPNKELQVYVTTINSDGSITKSASKSIAVTEYTDLPAIYADVFGTTPDGGYGTTTWVWNTEAADGCWGNGGYLGNTGPGWWICDAVGDVGNGRGQIDEQAVGKGLPDDGLNGWFSLSLTGVQTSRGESGSVKVSEDVVQSGWDQNAFQEGIHPHAQRTGRSQERLQGLDAHLHFRPAQQRQPGAGDHDEEREDDDEGAALENPQKDRQRLVEVAVVDGGDDT